MIRRNIPIILLVLIFSAAMLNLTMASSIAFIPITLTNNQQVASANGLQVAISFNSMNTILLPYEANDLGNIRFYNTNTPANPANELYSWCQSGCNDTSATNSTFWLKLPVSIVPAIGSIFKISSNSVAVSRNALITLVPAAVYGGGGGPNSNVTSASQAYSSLSVSTNDDGRAITYLCAGSLAGETSGVTPIDSIDSVSWTTGQSTMNTSVGYQTGNDCSMTFDNDDGSNNATMSVVGITGSFDNSQGTTWGADAQQQGDDFPVAFDFTPFSANELAVVVIACGGTACNGISFSNQSSGHPPNCNLQTHVQGPGVNQFGTSSSTSIYTCNQLSTSATYEVDITNSSAGPPVPGDVALDIYEFPVLPSLISTTASSGYNDYICVLAAGGTGRQISGPSFSNDVAVGPATQIGNQTTDKCSSGFAASGIGAGIAVIGVNTYSTTRPKPNLPITSTNGVISYSVSVSNTLAIVGIACNADSTCNSITKPASCSVATYNAYSTAENAIIYACINPPVGTYTFNSGSTTSSTAMAAFVFANYSLISNSIRLNMTFQPTNTEYDGSVAGEAPQLSSTYAKYDNGGNVFNFYMNAQNVPTSLAPPFQWGCDTFDCTFADNSLYDLAMNTVAAGTNTLAVSRISPFTSNNDYVYLIPSTNLPQSFIATLWSYTTGNNPNVEGTDDVIGLAGTSASSYAGYWSLFGDNGQSQMTMFWDYNGPKPNSRVKLVNSGGSSFPYNEWVSSGLEYNSTSVTLSDYGYVGRNLVVNGIFNNVANTLSTTFNSYVVFGGYVYPASKTSKYFGLAIVRQYPPNGIAPTPVLGGMTSLVTAMAFNAFSSSPTLSATLDVGQSITFNASVYNGLGPYTYNYILSNTVTGTIVASQSSTSNLAYNSFTWAVPAGGNTIRANVLVTDAEPVKANSVYLQTLTTDPAIATNALLLSGNPITLGQSVTLTAGAKGGAQPYTFYWFGQAACAGASIGSGSAISNTPSATTTFSFNVVDSATTNAVACSSSNTVTVVPPTTTTTIGGGGSSSRSVIITDNVTGTGSSNVPVIYTYVLQSGTSTETQYNQDQLPAIVTYPSSATVVFSFACAFQFGGRSYVYADDVYGLGVSAPCATNATASAGSYTVTYSKTALNSSIQTTTSVGTTTVTRTTIGPSGSTVPATTTARPTTITGSIATTTIAALSKSGVYGAVSNGIYALEHDTLYLLFAIVLGAAIILILWLALRHRKKR